MAPRPVKTGLTLTESNIAFYPTHKTTWQHLNTQSLTVISRWLCAAASLSNHHIAPTSGEWLRCLIDVKGLASFLISCRVNQHQTDRFKLVVIAALNRRYLFLRRVHFRLLQDVGNLLNRRCPTIVTTEVNTDFCNYTVMGPDLLTMRMLNSRVRYD